MNRIPCQAAFAALLCCLAAPLALASTPEETRLLGSDQEEAQFQSYLPFTRTLAASGVVSGTLTGSIEAAGVPPAAMVEALAAFGAVIDPAREIRDGDRFYVRYERTFTVDGTPIGTGRILWAELRTQAKGTLAIHRFRPLKASTDSFWLSTGQAAVIPGIRLPLDTINISSGFGMRADPFDQPAWRGRVTVGGKGGPEPARPGAPAPMAGKGGKANTAPPPPASPFTNPAAVPNPAAAATAPPAAGAWAPKVSTSGATASLATPGAAAYRGFAQRPTAMAMHEGVDLAANLGTPIHAAGDGVVRGAEMKGGYGNWIEIEHDELKAATPQGKPAKISTVYGHLLSFAPGIVAGTRVKQGDVIGFVGSTGRSTGPHLHFEILQNGYPTNPMISQTLRAEQLKGGDLERFRKAVARDLRERQNEADAI